MSKIKYMAGAVFAVMAISSCNDDTMTVGESLTKDGSADKMTLTSGTFEATSQTVVVDSVLANINDWYFGRVKDPQTQTTVTSEFTSQFYLLENLYIATEKEIVNKEDGKPVADSCDIIIYTQSPFSSLDLLSAMQMRIREMQTAIGPSKAYYSNFDPENYIRKDDDAIDFNHSFTYTNMNDAETNRNKTNYYNNIRIPLNQPYKGKDGTSYKNYGTYILQKLVDYQAKNKQRNPNSYVFSHDICPGFAFEIVDGLGFHAAVTDIGLRVFYTMKTDSVFKNSIVVAGTEEVVQTVKITYDKDEMAKLAKETDHTYLKTPAALFTEVDLPVKNIWNGHDNDSLLSTKIIFQRINNDQPNERSLSVPQTVMLVMKDSLKTFFEKKQLPNSKTSYYTNFNASNNTYTFSNISNMITTMKTIRETGIKKIMKETPTKTREQATTEWENTHPSWNKAMLVPIVYETSTTSTAPTKVGHSMSLSSTRLVGGKNKKISMSVVYGRFSK